jgi:hypothetical protein
MRDPLDPRNETNERQAGAGVEKRADPRAPDREVAMPTADLPSAVHAWLDGDTVTEATLSGAERELALWKRISAETGRRRRMVTPAYVSAQILAKLADD